MAPIPDTIKRLVDTFERNIELFKSGSINETQLRREYLDPFFTSLGWDVENKQGYADAYKDVIHEYSLKTKDVREAPDYCFRIGGTRKFFVEAKKPSVNVKEDIHPAYQLRSYAWSAKLPLSILTDFEEFAVYDCRILPNKKDKASTARILFFTFQEYLSRWNEIEEIFARESILKGSFDKYVETNKKKKGTAEVDEVFLQQMEEWRKSLAKNIAVRNPKLNIRELNFAVQKTIDRMIFLRICEDRGIEDYGQLMTLQNGTNVYERLKQVYHRADEKYNSGLFHFEVEKERNEPPDEITLSLKIDDKTIKDIIRELYYPDSPYEFSVLPADILGQVYEQFLGKVIRLTSAHHAVVDDKPEVKKAGGVYYTPTYIVDYIVKNTLGKLLPSPPFQGGVSRRDGVVEKVSNIKVLDPACGSGSFLLGAYQYLLDWHLKYYTSSEETIKKYSETKRQPIYRNDRGNYLLTTSEKKRILLNNIYGVDIDQQAVEVTKLSLMLKVLEGESTETLSNELKFFRERALPDLSNNIKCGNSLIGPDFYDQMEMNFLDDEEKLRINVFDWHKEFPNVFNRQTERSRSVSDAEESHGFDVVIGNPPWGADFSDFELKYLKEKHRNIIVRMIDSYMYFINQSLSVIDTRGIFGMIIPSTLLNQTDLKLLRDTIIHQYKIEDVINLGEKIFGSKVLNTSTVLTFSHQSEVVKDNHYVNIKDIRNISPNEKRAEILLRNNVEYKVWKKLVVSNTETIFYTSDVSKIFLFEKLKNQFESLNKIIEGNIQRGISPDYKDAFIVENKKAKELGIEKEVLKPIILGKHISRYKKPHTSESIIYLTPKDDINKYPNAKAQLSKFRDKITCREVEEGKHPWFSLHRPRDPKIFNSPKFIGLTTTRKLCITIDTNSYYTTDALFVFALKPNFELEYNEVLGILHSKTFQFLYDMSLQGENRVIPQIKAAKLNDLPFPISKDDNLKHTTIFKKIREHVDRLFELNEIIEKVKTPQEKTALERQIEATDKQIDQLVYQLYGLTEEEIKIVEEKN